MPAGVCGHSAGAAREDAGDDDGTGDAVGDVIGDGDVVADPEDAGLGSAETAAGSRDPARDDTVADAVGSGVPEAVAEEEPVAVGDTVGEADPDGEADPVADALAGADAVPLGLEVGQADGSGEVSAAAPKVGRRARTRAPAAVTAPAAHRDRLRPDPRVDWGEPSIVRRTERLLRITTSPVRAPD